MPLTDNYGWVMGGIRDPIGLRLGTSCTFDLAEACHCHIFIGVTVGLVWP